MSSLFVERWVQLSPRAETVPSSTAREQAEAYDIVPESHTRYYGHTLSGVVHRIYFDTAIRLLSAQLGERILDAGCACGDLALMAAKAGASVAGFDISWKQVEYAREKSGEQGVAADFFAGDVEAMAVRAGAFDKVLFVQVLHRLDAPLAALVEIHSCLKPGGTVVVLTMNLLSPQFRLLQFYLWLRSKVGFPVSERVSRRGFAMAELRRFFAEAGFEVVYDSTANVVVPYGPVFCPKLLGDALFWLNTAVSRVPLVRRLGTARALVLRKF